MRILIIFFFFFATFVACNPTPNNNLMGDESGESGNESWVVLEPLPEIQNPTPPSWFEYDGLAEMASSPKIKRTEVRTVEMLAREYGITISQQPYGDGAGYHSVPSFEGGFVNFPLPEGLEVPSRRNYRRKERVVPKQPNFGASRVRINLDRDFRSALRSAKKRNSVLVLGTSWCSPCKAIKKHLEQEGFQGGREVTVTYKTLKGKDEGRAIKRFESSAFPLFIVGGRLEENLSRFAGGDLSSYELSTAAVRAALGL